MVNLSTLLIPAGLGLLAYIAGPWLFARYYPTSWLVWVGNFYFSLAMQSFQRVAIARRQLGGLELVPLDYDSSIETGKLDLDEPMAAADPDNRIHRLLNRPLGLFYEKTPLLFDAQLVELAAAWADHRTEGRDVTDSTTTAPAADGGTVTVDEPTVNPYFRVDDDLRAVDPASVLELVPNDADPQDPETAKEFTREAFRLYGKGITVAQGFVLITSFAVTFGSVVLVNNYILEGSGGGGPGATSAPIPIGQLVADVAVILL